MRKKIVWTKKYDEFAIAHSLRPSTALMLRWILRRAKLNEISEIELDLRLFNRWVEKKRGRGYDRKTIREAIAQLDEQTQGMISILKSYTPWVHKIIVRPLAFLPQDEPKKRGQIPNPKYEKLMFDEERKQRSEQQQQQSISKIDKLFHACGLIFDADALNRIWRLAGKCMNNVVNAIELMLYRNGNKAIASPHGFIVDCLKYNWQQGFDLYYQPELPKFQSNRELIKFCQRLRE